MRCLRLLPFIFLIFIIFSGTVNAQNGYTVQPAGHPATYSDYGYKVPFRELPVTAQLIYLSAMLGACAVLLKMMPYVLGKIDDILKNENRSNILNYIYKNPGSTIAQVSQSQQIERATVKYHLYKLESEGKIVLRKMGKYSRVFRNSRTFSEEEQKIIAYLQNRNSRAILMLVMERPGITNQELTEQLGVEKSAISWHMDKFIGDGLVSYLPDGKFKRYYIPDNTVTALQKHAGSYAS